MLIKYRSGVVNASWNARHTRRACMVMNRSIVHYRSSFTLKTKVFTRSLTTGANQSLQVMNITVNNNPITLADYHPMFQNYDWGMITFF